MLQFGGFRESKTNNESHPAEHLSLSSPTTPNLQPYVQRLFVLASSANTKELTSALQSLKFATSHLGAQTVKTIINSTLAPGDPTLLHRLCIGTTSYEAIELLLSMGANPNTPCLSQQEKFLGPTPLFLSLTHRNLRITGLLLRYGANPNLCNNYGENALMHLARSWAIDRAVSEPAIKLLIRYGASPDQPDYKGATPISMCISRGDWTSARLLQKHGATWGHASASVNENAINILQNRAICELNLVDEDGEGPLQRIFDNFKTLQDTLGHHILSEIFNRPFGDGPSLFARMLSDGVSSKLLAMAQNFGANFDHSFSHRYCSVRIDEMPTFHFAILSNNPETLSFAIQATKGRDINRTCGKQLFTPLHLLYLRDEGEYFPEPPKESLVRMLINHGANPLIRSADGRSLFERATDRRDPLGIHLFSEFEANPYVTGHELLQEAELQNTEFRDKIREWISFAQLRVLLPASIEREMMEFAGADDTIRRGKLYAAAYRTATNPLKFRSDSTELLVLMPEILFSQKPSAFLQLIGAIERLNDTNPAARGYHPFEAELMALFAHPSQDSRVMDLLRQNSLTLTSINRFINFGLTEIPRDIYTLWGRIGVLSFSFRCWKWDARGLGTAHKRVPSLFEEFGFEHMRFSSTEPFGLGFRLSNQRKRQIQESSFSRDGYVAFDARTTIEFRRGYVMASHPLYGKLIVRNSVFGRSFLYHPAYYASPDMARTLSEKMLRSLSPQTIESRFNPILLPQLYKGQTLATPEIDALVSQLEHVKHHYSEWKFNTHKEYAWERLPDTPTILQGGYFSPGYPKLVRFLREAVSIAAKRREPAPELAFFLPTLPPWAPLSFQDLDNKQHSSLSLTPFRLDLLEEYATSTQSLRDVDDIDRRCTHNFFQRGFDSGAELVIIDKKKEADL